MPTCKKCGSGQAVRNGVVGGRQRYRCKDCGCNYRTGDGRTDDGAAAKKAMCVLLHSMAKGSFRALGRMFGRSHTLIYRWVRSFGEGLPEPEVPGGIREMEFDEMLRFVESQKTGQGPSGRGHGPAGVPRRLTVAHGEPWPGCRAIVILQHGPTTE